MGSHQGNDEECPECKQHKLEFYYDSKDALNNEEICWGCGYLMYYEKVENKLTPKELWQRMLDTEHLMWEWEEYSEDLKNKRKKYEKYEDWLKKRITAEKL